MNLHEIKDKILTSPTVMEMADELAIVNALMNIEANDIENNKDIFCNIIDALELSHIDSGFMEVSADNEDKFISFHCWLKKINSEYGLAINSNVIDSFGLTVNDIEKAMSKPVS